MLEIIFLVIAITGIGTLARGKKVSPIVAGSIAAVGFVLLRLGSFIGGFLFVLIAWAWIGLVAGFLKFVMGAGQPKPDGRWNCSNCRYLNQASSQFCEACQTPWQSVG